MYYCIYSGTLFAALKVKYMGALYKGFIVTAIISLVLLSYYIKRYWFKHYSGEKFTSLIYIIVVLLV